MLFQSEGSLVSYFDKPLTEIKIITQVSLVSIKSVLFNGNVQGGYQLDRQTPPYPFRPSPPASGAAHTIVLPVPIPPPCFWCPSVPLCFRCPPTPPHFQHQCVPQSDRAVGKPGVPPSEDTGPRQRWRGPLTREGAVPEQVAPPRWSCGAQVLLWCRTWTGSSAHSPGSQVQVADKRWASSEGDQSRIKHKLATRGPEEVQEGLLTRTQAELTAWPPGLSVGEAAPEACHPARHVQKTGAFPSQVFRVI